MNKLKIVSAAFLAAALVLLGVYTVREKAGQDRKEPVIAVDGDLIEVSVADGEEALLQGITASDTEDGDLTDKVMVESVGRFDKEGRRTVTYAVIDSDSLVAHASRKLTYSDYTPTRFSTDKPLSFEMGTTDLTGRIQAYDCLDGDLTASVKLTSEEGIEVAQSGHYEAALKVTNSAGATSVLPVTVEIYDPSVRSSVPLITLSDYVVYIAEGTAFDPKSYLQSVTTKGTEYAFTSEEGTFSMDDEAGMDDASSMDDAAGNDGASGTDDAAVTARGSTINYKYVTIESSVNPQAAGNYEVHYTFSDGTGVTGMATLYVVVTEGGAR